MPTHNAHTDVYTYVVIHSSTEELNKSMAEKRTYVAGHKASSRPRQVWVCVHSLLVSLTSHSVVHCYVHASHRTGSTKRTQSSGGAEDRPGHVQPSPGRYIFTYVLLLCAYGVVVQMHRMSTHVFIHAHT